MIHSSEIVQVDDSKDLNSNPTEDGGRSTCPLCGLVAEDATEIYTHLQVSHRKSEIAGLVVDW